MVREVLTMCMSSGQQRDNTLQQAVLLLLLFSLADALKAGIGVDLPDTGPLLNVQQDFDQLVESKLNDTSSRDILSRQRRYLVFPEGSSFQVVYDEYICVVDYTNYLVLGVTVALAWELPSKPPSEALDDLLIKLATGTIDVSRNDIISNISYVDDAANSTASTDKISSSVFRPPMHISHQYGNSYYRPRPRPAGSKPARRKDSYYYSSSVRNPLKQWSQSYSPVRATRFPYWALPSHIQERNKLYSPSKPQLNPQQEAPRVPTSSARPPPQKYHRIYPIFGKRSIPDPSQPHMHHRQRRSGTTSVEDEQLTRMEGNQIKYHRNSRQKLYERIEKYLDKRGQNGHQCVLRTLCETGQKSGEREPGSFVGELLRALFTIPEALDHEPVAYRDTRYDKAHAHTGDCAALYPECKQSLWDAHFVQ